MNDRDRKTIIEDVYVAHVVKNGWNQPEIRLCYVYKITEKSNRY